MGTALVIEGVVASESPEAWRQRVEAKGGADFDDCQTQDGYRCEDGQGTQCDPRHVGGRLGANTQGDVS
jgi:hypothetical protein